MTEKIRDDGPPRWMPLPLSLQKPDTSWSYHRGIALSLMLWISTALSLLIALALLVFYGVWNFPLQTQVLLSFGGLVIQSLQLWAFLHYGHIKRSATIFTTVMFYLALGLVFFTGGPDSVYLPLLICCTVVACRIGSRLEGMIFAALITLVGLGLALAEQYGFTFPTSLDNLDRRAAFGISWSVTLIVFSVCMSTYHHRTHETED